MLNAIVQAEIFKGVGNQSRVFDFRQRVGRLQVLLMGIIGSNMCACALSLYTITSVTALSTACRVPASRTGRFSA
ncbi:hypothetical protein [uncultured Pantoea sp.]|uniref:hypothetical protein n=1 Tax=Pantoea ananas TaxID=553 RepID=UPI00048B259A|nr:hypothetical protein [uncultured Pantoea sp.]MDC7862797.1 hypothetical protein [Pantoea ananatis]